MTIKGVSATVTVNSEVYDIIRYNTLDGRCPLIIAKSDDFKEDYLGYFIFSKGDYPELLDAEPSFISGYITVEEQFRRSGIGNLLIEESIKQACSENKRIVGLPWSLIGKEFPTEELREFCLRSGLSEFTKEEIDTLSSRLEILDPERSKEQHMQYLSSYVVSSNPLSRCP